MFEKRKMMFLYVESPLHAGTGRGLGSIDMPIQRERATDYPILQASGLKGKLRAAYREKYNLEDEDSKVTEIFGKAASENESYCGAFAIGDARLLLFPVRSLTGIFAYVTSEHALESFKRSALLSNFTHNLPEIPKIDPILESDQAWVSRNTILNVGDVVVLEEFSYRIKQANHDEGDKVEIIGEEIAEAALPSIGYEYWKTNLPRRLCILTEDAFRDFVLNATEVQTHIKLVPKTKTVDAKSGALWTVESLPVDTLLYAPLMASKSRKNGAMNAEDVLKAITDLGLTRIQMGGDETTGQGWVFLKIIPEEV